MVLRFLSQICGDAIGSAARRLHRDVGDEMREFSRAFYQHRMFVQFRAERDYCAGVCSEALGSARRLRRSVEDEGEKFCRGIWAHRKRILDIYLALNGVNYILKFPDPEPAELKEFAAEETLKEEAMRWRFEQYLIAEHGCKYRTRERVKARLFNLFKECALDVEKVNAEGGGVDFGTDQFWVADAARSTMIDATVYGSALWR